MTERNRGDKRTNSMLTTNIEDDDKGESCQRHQPALSPNVKDARIDSKYPH